MVEWSITTVLKTVVLRGTGGSNPSLSAKRQSSAKMLDSFFMLNLKKVLLLTQKTKNNTKSNKIGTNLTFEVPFLCIFVPKL